MWRNFINNSVIINEISPHVNLELTPSLTEFEKKKCFINNPAIINYLFLMKIFSNMTSTTLPHLTPLFFFKKGMEWLFVCGWGVKGQTTLNYNKSKIKTRELCFHSGTDLLVDIKFYCFLSFIIYKSTKFVYIIFFYLFSKCLNLYLLNNLFLI